MLIALLLSVLILVILAVGWLGLILLGDIVRLLQEILERS